MHAYIIVILVISDSMVFTERCNDYLYGSESCQKNQVLKIISQISKEHGLQCFVIVDIFK